MTSSVVDRTILSGVLCDARRMLDATSQMLMETPAELPGEAELKSACEGLQIVCDEVGSLVGGVCDYSDEASDAATTTVMLPRVLVLGQPKSGKSSFINELLGQTVVQQTEAPNDGTTSLTRVRYAPQAFRRRVAEAADAAEAEASEIGLPIELLREAGVELVDATGCLDSPPAAADATGDLLAAALIVYVIDATCGITREVEKDLEQLRDRCTPEQLIIVLNKAEAAVVAGVTPTDAEAAMRHQALSRLRQLGFQLDGVSDSGSGDCGGSSEQSSKLFCISCRRLRALRRRRRQQNEQQEDQSVVQTETDEQERLLLATLDRMRGYILGGIQRRLESLLGLVAERLSAASEALQVHAGKLTDVIERKAESWSNVLDVESIMIRGLTNTNSTALVDKMCNLVKSHKRDILEAVRAMQLPEGQQQQPQQLVEVIKQQVLDLQRHHCEEFATAEMSTRLQSLDDVHGALRTFQDVLATPVPGLGTEEAQAILVGIDRKFSMKEDLTFQKLGHLLTRRASIRLASIGKPSWANLKWREDEARKFMRSVDLRPALTKAVERLESVISTAHTDIQKAVSEAQVRVKKFQEALKTRRRGLRQQRRQSLKLQLRLQSLLSEGAPLREGFQWHQKTCIGVGSQGGAVYRVCQQWPPPDGSSDSAGPARVMAVKQMMLTDDQLGDMAQGLHYSCNSQANDSVLHVKWLQLKPLSPRPTVAWKLCLWMELMERPSLQHQLPGLCQDTQLAARLAIGLAIADALARLHQDKLTHANLRLSNVFLCDAAGRSVKLADIGQARTVPLLMHKRQIFDAVEFPPEVLPRSAGAATSSGEVRSVHHVSLDVYSLGIILKALVFGRDQPPPFEEANEELNDLIAECTEQSDSRKRPPLADVVERLRRILAVAEEKRSDTIKSSTPVVAGGHEMRSS